MTEQPQYDHDCDRCTFLGRWDSYDLYHCLQSGLGNAPTVIARFSDDGPDYTSGMAFVGTGKAPALDEAHRRAVERGLIEQ